MILNRVECKWWWKVSFKLCLPIHNIMFTNWDESLSISVKIRNGNRNCEIKSMSTLAFKLLLLTLTKISSIQCNANGLKYLSSFRSYHNKFPTYLLVSNEITWELQTSTLDWTLSVIHMWMSQKFSWKKWQNKMYFFVQRTSKFNGIKTPNKRWLSMVISVEAPKKTDFFFLINYCHRDNKIK